MKFHDTSNTHDSLTHYINFLCDITESDTTVYSLAQKARAASTGKYKLALEVWKNADGWDFDDNGQSDLPTPTTTLVADQRDYTLPTTAIEVWRVEVKDAAGNYYQLEYKEPTDDRPPQALTNYGESSAAPRFYWLVGRSLFLDPAPASGAFTASAGLKIYLRREVVEFTASTTTSEVGFGEPGDRIVGMLSALEWVRRKKPELVSGLEIDLYGGTRNGKIMPGLWEQFISQISRRNKRERPKIRIDIEDME